MGFYSKNEDMNLPLKTLRRYLWSLGAFWASLGPSECNLGGAWRHVGPEWFSERPRRDQMEARRGPEARQEMSGGTKEFVLAECAWPVYKDYKAYKDW